MNNKNESVGRQRLAWVILASSFFICLVISVAIPISANAFIQSATQVLVMEIQSNQGTVGIDDETGTRRAIIAGDISEILEPNTSILTDATATAILFVSTPLDEILLARLNIDSNTIVRINQATTPRFGWSNEEHMVNFELESGRIRMSLPNSNIRPLDVNLITPQGAVTMEAGGQFSVEVTNEATQIAVQEGTVSIAANDQTLFLSGNQRGEIPTGAGPLGPLDPERNLIQNGDFGQGFAHWSEYTWKVELGDQPPGNTDISVVDGDPVLRFERNGAGHADARVSQSINQTVSDDLTLWLMLSLRILEQSLGVCGIQGSECPLFIRINYLDENGVSQIWQHGFFSSGEIDDNATPGACVSCAVIQSNHERVPAGQEYFYQIDLREELARQGALPPRYIESVSLVASGHRFITEVIDVALVTK